MKARSARRACGATRVTQIILVWVGFCLASLTTSHGWITFACPLLIYYFLTKITGIPLTEEYALKSKGEAYREYQRTTNAFVPWFRKA